MAKRYSTADFIEKARGVHGDRYDYSKTEYVNSRTKVVIICPIHGEFKQRPDIHLRGSVCLKCSYNSQKLTIDQFKDKSNSIHNNTYKYNKVKYTGNKTKVIITCPVHGDFEQRPSDHMKGYGCDKCAKEHVADLNRLSTDEFIERSISVHGDKYDYSKVIYECIQNNVEIICSKHGSFFQIAGNHMRGSNCPECVSDEKKLGNDDFILISNDVHDNFYTYNKVKYTGNKTKVIITCPVHGDFKQTPNNHMRGVGCPKCSLSKGEQRIMKYLNDKNINHKEQFSYKDCRNKKPLPFDFYLPDYNILIEYDGEHHHKAWRYKNEKKSLQKFKTVQHHDKIKNEYCKKNNIKLIRIPYWDFDRIEEILDKELFGGG